MGHPDPLSDEGLRQLHPSNTDQDEVPESYKNRLEAWKRLKENAPREYREMLARDDLDVTTESEGPFLAKMYLIAKHYGEDVRYYTLLDRAVKLRPDRVQEAAGIFNALSSIYIAMGKHLKAYWEAAYPEHWSGDGADSYHDEIQRALTHISGDDLSLHMLAKNTSTLMAKFAEALIQWRKDVANAIRRLAELDRMQALTPNEVLEIPSDDPISSAAKTLKALLTAFDRINKAGEETDDIFKKFATVRGIKLNGLTPEHTDRQSLTNPDPWSGSLRAG